MLWKGEQKSHEAIIDEVLDRCRLIGLPPSIEAVQGIIRKQIRGRKPGGITREMIRTRMLARKIEIPERRKCY